MKKLMFLTFLVFLMFSGDIYGQYLSDLMWSFKERTGESQDTTEALPQDTAIMDWLNQAQAKVVRMGGMLPKRTDVVVDNDSIKYALPSDFKIIRYILIRDGGKWQRANADPGFQSEEVIGYSYSQDWEHSGQAELYIKGTAYSEGDTLRVFYLAVAPELIDRVDSCYVPAYLHGLIIDEAIGYYEWSKRNMSGYQIMINGVRLDMGVPTQGEKRK